MPPRLLLWRVFHLVIIVVVLIKVRQRSRMEVFTDVLRTAAPYRLERAASAITLLLLLLLLEEVVVVMMMMAIDARHVEIFRVVQTFARIEKKNKSLAP